MSEEEDNSDDFQESFDFDELDSSEPEESDFPETFGLADLLADGDMVAGILQNMDTDVGQYNSTVYAIRVQNSELSNHNQSEIVDEDGVIQFWGNNAVDHKVELADLEVGDVIAVRRDGTYENEYGEFDNYEVRFRKFD